MFELLYVYVLFAGIINEEKETEKNKPRVQLSIRWIILWLCHSSAQYSSVFVSLTLFCSVCLLYDRCFDFAHVSLAANLSYSSTVCRRIFVFGAFFCIQYFFLFFFFLNEYENSGKMVKFVEFISFNRTNNRKCSWTKRKGC